jgi:peptidyl-prolyl cis-trans isomerase C
VTARHILCRKRAEAEDVKQKFRKGNFAQLAKQYSTCPSGERGGNLGTFRPGQMAPDFDEAVFDPTVSKVGELTGPIMTPFGYHLIIVDKRTGV